MNEDETFLISAYDLKKDYPSPAGRLAVLSGVYFNLKPGQISLVVGRSGSGKSTLLHLLGGLDVPTSGKIIFEGENLTAMKESKLARVRNARIGFVFQSYHLLPELTVYENVLLPTLIARKRNVKWVKEILGRVGLTDRRDHFPSALSGGEQQRAAIARALANRPSVVLCDEPTGNLDRESADSVIALINELNRKDGQSFVVVTHDESFAWRYPDVYRLTDGVLLAEASRPLDARQVR